MSPGGWDFGVVFIDIRNTWVEVILVREKDDKFGFVNVLIVEYDIQIGNIGVELWWEKEDLRVKILQSFTKFGDEKRQYQRENAG